MQSLQGNRLEAMTLTGQVAASLGRVHYFRGRQAVYAGTHRDLLEDLRQTTVTQGTQASNGIEGIWIPDDRYYAITKKQEAPLTRPEQAVVGYQSALEYIHLHSDKIEVSPETIKDLHRRIYQQSPGDESGEFRAEKNEIVRKDEAGNEQVVFVPTPPSLVANQIEELCRQYHRLLDKPDIDQFMLLAGFVLDFTCIHPFMDGNGRVSRLLTTLLAYKMGFEFVRYIPHEKLIYDTKGSYYYALTESSKDWHRGNHRWVPWLSYLAGIFEQSGQMLEERLFQKEARGFKSEKIREVIRNLPSEFTIRDIITALPHATRPTIALVLKEEKEAGRIQVSGRGRGASYRKVSKIEPPKRPLPTSMDEAGLEGGEPRRGLLYYYNLIEQLERKPYKSTDFLKMFTDEPSDSGSAS